MADADNGATSAPLEGRPASEQEQLPRFLEATEQIVDYFDQLGRQAGELSQPAQHFDFVLSQDSLEPVQQEAAKKLRAALNVTDGGVDETIRGIYQTLYGESLNTILGVETTDTQEKE
jgi:hypothetical protein